MPMAVVAVRQSSLSTEPMTKPPQVVSLASSTPQTNQHLGSAIAASSLCHSLRSNTTRSSAGPRPVHHPLVDLDSASASRPEQRRPRSSTPRASSDTLRAHQETFGA